jgi:hypothetical protein
MINIFEVFLPQLLRYPNPTDPLNGEAAALLMREPKSYEAKVKGEQTMTHTILSYSANGQQSTSPSMLARMLRMKPGLSLLMTTTCHPLAALAMRRTRSQLARWRRFSISAYSFIMPSIASSKTVMNETIIRYEKSRSMRFPMHVSLVFIKVA